MFRVSSTTDKALTTLNNNPSSSKSLSQQSSSSSAYFLRSSNSENFDMSEDLSEFGSKTSVFSDVEDAPPGKSRSPLTPNPKTAVRSMTRKILRFHTTKHKDASPKPKPMLKRVDTIHTDTPASYTSRATVMNMFSKGLA